MTARLGLRGRIAVTVLVALLVPSALFAAIGYHVLRDRAEHDFRARALSTALSDFTSAANAITGRARPRALISAHEALAVRKSSTYVVYSMKPDESGAGYTLPGPNPPFEEPAEWPGPLATRVSNASDVQTSAVPAAEFMRTRINPRLLDANGLSPMSAMDEHSLASVVVGDGRWLAVGAVVGYQGDADRYPGAPVVAVEFHAFQPVDDEARACLRGLLALSAVIVAIGALLAWLVAGRVQRPVSAAGAAARELGAGDLTVRLPVAGRDELSDLSSSFNQMADRLAAMIGQLTRHDARQRRFVADVSHELRTPTAALLAAATALENPATRDGAARLVIPQLRRLARLTEDLLEISRMDAGEATVAFEPVDLAGLVADVVAHCGAPESVTVGAEGDTTADVDPRRMHAVITNLVANALRHGAAPVRVTVRETPDRVVVQVADSGAGIPDALLERVFDRFVRADEARAAGSGFVGSRSVGSGPAGSGPAGSGLGLAIAKENARLQGATLTAANDDGAVFTLGVARR